MEIIARSALVLVLSRPNPENGHSNGLGFNPPDTLVLDTVLHALIFAPIPHPSRNAIYVGCAAIRSSRSWLLEVFSGSIALLANVRCSKIFWYSLFIRVIGICIEIWSVHTPRRTSQKQKDRHI